MTTTMLWCIMHQKQFVNAQKQFSTQVVQFTKNCLQCFDTVGGVPGRAPGLWVAGVVISILSRARCKWFAYGLADATDIPSSLASLKSRMVLPFGAALPRLSWKKATKWVFVQSTKKTSTNYSIFPRIGWMVINGIFNTDVYIKLMSTNWAGPGYM